MVAGGSEAFGVDGGSIGAVLGFHSGDQVAPHFVREQLMVHSAGFIFVIVGGEHHEEGLAQAHVDDVVDHVFRFFIADEAFLGFIGAMEEIDDVVLLGGVIAIGHIHVGPLVHGFAVHVGGVFHFFDGAGVVTGCFPELGLIVFEVQFDAAVQFGHDVLPVFGRFPSFRQGGHGAAKHEQRKQQRYDPFHGFSPPFYSGRYLPSRWFHYKQKTRQLAIATA